MKINFIIIPVLVFVGFSANAKTYNLTCSEPGIDYSIKTTLKIIDGDSNNPDLYVFSKTLVTAKADSSCQASLPTMVSTRGWFWDSWLNFASSSNTGSCTALAGKYVLRFSELSLYNGLVTVLEQYPNPKYTPGFGLKVSYKRNFLTASQDAELFCTNGK